VSGYKLGSQAIAGLRNSWEFIAADEIDAAVRVLEELRTQFKKLAEAPGLGHRRGDLTMRDVFFWPGFSYLVVYRPTTPLRVVRVLHSNRNISRIL
jgi:plasmid stabilization system protein ParE